MLALLRNLFISETAGEENARQEMRQGEVEQEEVQQENIDKAQAFTEWLLGDIYGCLAESTGLNIEFGEQDDDRCVPEQFCFEIISFSKVFIDKLMPDMSLRPLLLLHCEIFFTRFTNFVCLNLIKDHNPEIDFLKVMAFLMVLISTSFKYRCFRPLDDIPGVLYMLLKDDLKTKFYEEDRFDDILLKCDELKKDEKWCDSTVEEIRGYIKDSHDVEVATEIYDDPFRPDICRTRILDVKPKRSMSDRTQCPYCETDCILVLKGVWKPKVKTTFPRCRLM